MHTKHRSLPRWIRPRTLRTKFVYITVSLMLLLGIAISLFSHVIFARNLRAAAVHSAETNILFLKNTIDNQLASAQQLARWCQVNTDISAYLMTPADANSRQAIQNQAVNQLQEQYISNPAKDDIARVVVATEDGSHFLQRISDSHYSMDRRVVTIIRDLPDYDERLNGPALSFSSGTLRVPALSGSWRMLPILQRIESPISSRTIGFVFLQLSFDLFSAPLSDYSRAEQVPVFLTIGADSFQIRGSRMRKDAFPDTLLHTWDGELHEGTTVRRGPDHTLYVSVPLTAEGCHIAIPVHEAHLALAGPYLVVLLSVIGFVSVIGALLLVFLTRNVNRPVELLQQRMRRIAAGDFTRDPAVEWDNEFGEIGRTTNQMAADVQALMEQRMQYEKQKRDYEYQVLQSQINPHFLYNTLNSIKWMALAQHANGIADMTTALAHLLKNIAKGTTTIIPLREELHLLDDYFTIQKYRYGGAITLTYVIEDDALLDADILRFTLQPIVENAIFHGIEPKGKSGHIDVAIRLEKTPTPVGAANDAIPMTGHAAAKKEQRANTLLIAVTDDGVGMDPQTIAKVLASDASDHGSFFRQIGIGSVNRRMQYNFGSAYGVQIESEPGQYTRVMIRVPLQNSRAAQEHDSSAEQTAVQTADHTEP